MRFFGTYPVFFQEQPGNVDVPVLESVHERSDSTIVPAVRLVPAPGREGKSEGRVSSGSKTHPGPGASCCKGSRAPEKDKKPSQRPRINLPRCFTARGTGLLGIWGLRDLVLSCCSSLGLCRSFPFPRTDGSGRSKVCTDLALAEGKTSQSSATHTKKKTKSKPAGLTEVRALLK